MSDIQVTSVDGNQINVTTGVVVGPLPSLQIAAGTGITIASGGGVSTISANVSQLSIPSNLADLSNVNGSPAANQALIYTGTEWQPGNIPARTTINSLSGDLTLANGTGLTLAENGSTLTLSAAIPPNNLADLADVSAASPSTDQILTYNGSAWVAATDSTNLTGYATESFVAAAVANLVDSSPAALDTLNELAAALGDDANFAANVTASLAGKAAANHTHNIADVTGLQSALDDKAATANLATVATSGNYTDLAGIPSELTPAAHNHTSADITDFATAAAANAPIQTVNNATGDIVIANGTGLTLTANGSTLTLAAALPPSNLADLADVSGSPSANQALIYTGTEWQPGDIPAGATGSTGPQGDAGPTTNLTIGTVTTGTAGSHATATIDGTPPNLTLNLTIPRGETGANGTSGMSLGLFFALS